MYSWLLKMFPSTRSTSSVQATLRKQQSSIERSRNAMIIILCFLFTTNLFASENRIQEMLFWISSEHPKLKSITEELAAKIHSSKYAHLKYPDPKFGVSWLNYPYKKDLRFIEDKTPMTGVEFKFIQPIPFPGRLSTEASISDKEIKISRLKLALEKNKLAKEFLDLVLELRSLILITSLTKEFEEKITLVTDIANTKYSVGKGNLSDVSKARLKRQAYTEKKIRFDGLLKSRLKSLSYFLEINSDKKTEKYFSKNSKFIKDLNRYIDFLENKVNGNVDIPNASILVAIRNIEGEKSALNSKLAKYNYLPDFEVFAAYRKRAYIPTDPTPGENFMSAGVSMRLPLWSALSNHQNVQSHNNAYKASRYLAQDSVQSDNSLFESLKINRLTTKERIKIYKENLLVDAEESLESTRLAYQTGKNDFDSFLQAWDVLYNIKSEKIRLREEKDKQTMFMAYIINEILPDYKDEEVKKETNK